MSMKDFDLKMLATAGRHAWHSLEERKSGSVLVKRKKILGYSANIGIEYSYILAMKMAVERGHDIKGATLYMTHEPSRRDGMRIYDAGIKRVVWQEPFDRIGSDVLRAFGVEVVSYEK